MDGLRERVKELASELLELRQEYYETIGVGGDEVALQDDVEYLTGENRDLALKCKQLSLQNAVY